MSKVANSGISGLVAELNLVMPTEANDAVGSAIFEKVMRLYPKRASLMRFGVIV